MFQITKVIKCNKNNVMGGVGSSKTRHTLIFHRQIFLCALLCITFTLNVEH